LAPLREDWHELNADQRQKWLDLSLRFPTLHVEDQQRIQDRMRQWAMMSSAERGAARLNFQEIRALPAKDRLEQWEAYQGLPPGERKELAFKAQTAVQTPAVPRRADPSAPVPKSSGVAAETVAGAGHMAKPVGGTLVQAPIGATTRLVTQLPPASVPTPTGPRIAVQPGVVDPATLLPQARVGRPTAAPSGGGAAADGPTAGSDEPSSPAAPPTSSGTEGATPGTPSAPPAPGAP
jgi:hypothetical protein